MSGFWLLKRLKDKPNVTILYCLKGAIDYFLSCKLFVLIHSFLFSKQLRHNFITVMWCNFFAAQRCTAGPPTNPCDRPLTLWMLVILKLHCTQPPLFKL